MIENYAHRQNQKSGEICVEASNLFDVTYTYRLDPSTKLQMYFFYRNRDVT